MMSIQDRLVVPFKKIANGNGNYKPVNGNSIKKKIPSINRIIDDPFPISPTIKITPSEDGIKRETITERKETLISETIKPIIQVFKQNNWLIIVLLLLILLKD